MIQHYLFAHFLIFSYFKLFQITYQYFILVVKDFSFKIFLTMTYFLQQYLIFLNCNLRPIFAVSIFPHIQAVPDGRVSRARFAGLSFDIPGIIYMISPCFLFISSHCALYIDLTNIAVSLFTRTLSFRLSMSSNPFICRNMFFLPTHSFLQMTITSTYILSTRTMFHS